MDGNTHISILKQKIAAQDKEGVLSVLSEMRNTLSVNPALINEITAPVVITELHEQLVASLGVNPRAMQITRRSPNKTKRAMLFIMAMENGVKKLK